MSSARKVSEAKAICTVCDTEFIFWRKAHKRRAQNHTKHLYCVVCQDVTAHKEVRVSKAGE